MAAPKMPAAHLVKADATRILEVLEHPARERGCQLEAQLEGEPPEGPGVYWVIAATKGHLTWRAERHGPPEPVA